ncbi:MAG: ferritin-like domain-containing protein [Solirubrobacterales bacterium]
MSHELNIIYDSIDESNSEKSAHTRRQLVAGAAAAMGTVGALTLLDAPEALAGEPNTPETIINIAATAEVLATIVNTVGPEKVELDDTTKRNVRAAATEEKIHYEALVGPLGGKELTKKIWVPDSVFSNKENLLKTLVVGDQIFINAYLLATSVFSRPSIAMPKPARYAAEIMGVEAVHRALALQSLGVLGNDRAYMKFTQVEENRTSPAFGRNGFNKITSAVKYLEAGGFGLGEEGAKPGQFYDYDEVSKRTPDVDGVNTRKFT